MSFILNLLGGVWAKVAAIGAVVLAIVTFGAMKKREGKRDAEAAQLKKTHEIKRKQDAVKRPDPDDLDDNLRGL